MIKCRLKEIADKNGWNQSDLVAMTGVSPNTIQSYYYGNVIRPDMKVVETICDKLGIRFSDLFFRKDDEKAPKIFTDDPSRRPSPPTALTVASL